MEVLITYDVSTETAAGRKRLRQVAKACEGYGQRVQKSVFECIVNAAQLEALRATLERIVDPAQDSLRIYRLLEPRERYVQIIGVQPLHDLHNPLLI